jgi:hypothetical protein
MCLGIVFAAHHYYVAFGGQGFLKLRDQDATYRAGPFNAPDTYLPLRKIATLAQDVDMEERRRYVGPLEVPYYACGDQQSSCEAYGQSVRSVNLHQDQTPELTMLRISVAL